MEQPNRGKLRMRLLLFHLHDRRCGLHISAIERVVRAVEIMPLPDVPDYVLGVINVYGRILPVLNTRKRFGLPDKEMDVTDQMIIVHVGNHAAALLVDGVDGVMEYPDDGEVSARDLVAGADLVEGVVMLDGEMILVEDLQKLCAAIGAARLPVENPTP